MTLANILSDWRTLLLLEQSKYQELASDLNLTVSKPMRLAFTFFEAGKTDAAIGIMKSMLSCCSRHKAHRGHTSESSCRFKGQRKFESELC